jgi:glycosyltransferase involved in cell wall biosynthesis
LIKKKLRQKLKILHLLSQRPDSTGSGIYLQAMLREASARGHKNFVVAGIQADSSGELDCIDQDQCMFVKFGDAGIPSHIVGMSDIMPYKSRRFCDLSKAELHEYEAFFSNALKHAASVFKPDIIHSHHLWIFSSLARQLLPEIPMVTTCHGSDLRQFQNCRHLQERVLKGCRQIDAVMALSEAQKRDILALYNLSSEKVFVVGAGYNDLLFNVNKKPGPEPVQLIYAGKLSRAKGLPWLLRGLSMIDSPAWQLHLVGSGSGKERDDCIMLARDLGERVIMHGALSQKGLAEIMKQCHIVVLPSFYEGLPLVLLEGLASGCRVVATDLPGIKEVLGGIQADFISLVKTPRLLHIDQPYHEDETVFEENLAHAVKTQIHAARQCSRIDLSPVQDKIASFSWAGIFKKVQNVYFGVTNI